MSETPWRNGDILQEMYWDKGLSLSQIGERLGCSHNTVHRWMKKNGIETRTPTHERPPCFYTDERGYESWKHEIGDRESQHKVRIHRLLAVAEHGFDAVTGMDIHHKNKIPWDNRSENIQPIDHYDHASLHNKTTE